MTGRPARAHRRRRTAVAGGAAVVGGGLALAPVPLAEAATYTVTTGDDAGLGSLRQAVIDATPGDTIDFAPSVTSITLTSGSIQIDKDLTIQGPGAGSLTIDAGGTSRIFTIDDAQVTSSTVSIVGLTLTNGYDAVEGGAIASAEHLVVSGTVITGNATAGVGGGISSAGEHLGVVDSTIDGNTASNSGGGIRLTGGGTANIEGSTVTGNTGDSGGGGISLYDTTTIGRDVTITGSTISGNTTFSGGGGIVATAHVDLDISATTIAGNTAAGSGGGIQLLSGGTPKYYAQLALENATIAGNTAAGSGGGIDVAFSDAVIRSSTIAANSANSGGGISVVVGDGTADVENTIVADNTASSDPDVAGMVDLDFSLVEDPGGATLNGANNLTGVDPLLGALDDNGGPTLTMLPDPESPAVDAGDPAFAPPPATDQRGETRVVDDIIDMGAVELQPPPPPPPPPDEDEDDQDDLSPSTTTTMPPSEPAVRAAVPPPDGSGTSTVDVETDQGTVTVRMTGVEEGEDLVLSIRTVDADEAGMVTRGFRLLGEVYELRVERGSGNEAGDICFPVAGDADDARDPVVVHHGEDGRYSVLPTEARGLRTCATTDSFSAFAVGILDTRRLAGIDAASTAAAISASAFEPGVPVAYVVSATSPTDAAASGAAGGPVLLVDRDDVPAATQAELDRLDPARVVVVGGTGAVSDEVADRLGATRIAGGDRYSTAALLAERAHGSGVPVVYVVNGTSVTDVLVAAAAATADGGPVLLVTTDDIPGAARRALDALQPARVVVIGGTGVVSDAVVDELDATRIAGEDRYATAAAVATAIAGDAVIVARDDDPVDGIAGGPLGLPLLLVRPDEIPTATRLALRALAPSEITVLGGTAAVTSDNELRLARLLRVDSS